MKTRTATVVLPLERDRAFSDLADGVSLPRWATEAAWELKVVDGKTRVVNGLGEFSFEIRADERTGVIDMLAGPGEDELLLSPTRVVALGPGTRAFTFTVFQAPGTRDALSEGQYRSLLRELEDVRRELEP